MSEVTPISAQQRRQANILRDLGGTDTGWQFVSYVTINGGIGYCQVCHAKITKGVKISHPVAGERIVGRGVIRVYIPELNAVMPAMTDENTVAVDPPPVPAKPAKEAPVLAEGAEKPAKTKGGKGKAPKTAPVVEEITDAEFANAANLESSVADPDIDALIEGLTA